MPQLSDFLRSNVVAYDSLVKKRTFHFYLVCSQVIYYMQNELQGVLWDGIIYASDFLFMLKDFGYKVWYEYKSTTCCEVVKLMQYSMDIICIFFRDLEE